MRFATLSQPHEAASSLSTVIKQKHHPLGGASVWFEEIRKIKADLLMQIGFYDSHKGIDSLELRL